MIRLFFCTHKCQYLIIEQLRLIKLHPVGVYKFGPLSPFFVQIFLDYNVRPFATHCEEDNLG